MSGVYESLTADWALVLGRDLSGPDDDFFEAGGHSLAAIQLVARIRARYGIEVPVACVFTHSTAGGLAEEIARLLAEGVPAGEAGNDHHRV
ncbi:phosphopantetheine-binding protein [Nonomuraea recticatena]|uniref:Carrier domain-containing protein n=1 Tax=Nonomuraea recticatena TaxID=46178 RepID=A0ABP6FLP5_9ACTN